MIPAWITALPTRLARRYYAAAHEQAFQPAWWGVFVNPFFTSRRLLHREIARCAHQMTGGVLIDIGCGSAPYRTLFRVDRYWGVELAGGHGVGASRHSVLYDGERLPFRDGAADHIVMSEVLEHVFEPDALLEEVRRVLRPGGRLLVTVPFLWDEHEIPHDYGRYTSFGLRHLLARRGFEPIYAGKSGNYLSALGQMLSAYVYTTTMGWPGPARWIVYAAACAPVLVGSSTLGKLTRASSRLYLDNIVLARKA